MKKYLFLIFIVCFTSLQSEITFEKYMNWRYSPHSFKHSKLCKYSFNKNSFLTAKDLPKEKQIPKIIHQIWLGSPLPKQYYELIKTIKEKNPKWKYILWTDDNIHSLNLINLDKYETATNYGMKSDILRYEILSQYGGVYLDIDFIALKSFDALTTTASFFAGVISDGAILNGLIGSVPDHPILLDCIEEISKTELNPNRLNDFNYIMSKTGPGLLTRKIAALKRRELDNVAIYPEYFFYPIHHLERHTLSQQNKFKRILKRLKEENISFTLHCWETSWQKKY